MASNKPVKTKEEEPLWNDGELVTQTDFDRLIRDRKVLSERVAHLENAIRWAIPLSETVNSLLKETKR